MKNLIQIFIVACIASITLHSCSKDDSTASPARPTEGTYIIGINLGVETPLTKGVTSNGTFDNVYEPDVIYLHKYKEDGDDECLKIPIYNYDCQDPNLDEDDYPDGRCNGFRYQVEYKEDGTITLTAVNQNGDLIQTNTITVQEGDQFYFSSLPNRYWKVKDEDKNTDFTAPTSSSVTTNELYARDPETNIEIYRSQQDSYTLEEVLNLNGDLTMERKCAGFSFMALFRNPLNSTYTYPLTDTEFKNIMGDDLSNWYIKIYVGSMFTSEYDMQNETGAQTAGGFYGSTDVTKYNEYGTDDGYYLPFRFPIDQSSTLGGSQTITGVGYESIHRIEEDGTLTSNVLIAPTNENYSENLDIYIFIKHWNQEGTQPDEDWLTSNDDAIYTKVEGQQVMDITVQDGIFYECGVSIDINELKAAAIANGLIDDQTTSTKGMVTHDNKPKKFTLHNARTFVNY